MATYAENLIAARDAMTAQLAAMPIKPDYSVDGQSVQWGSERAKLLKDIADLNAMIQMADGGFEVRTQGYL